MASRSDNRHLMHELDILRKLVSDGNAAVRQWDIHQHPDFEEYQFDIIEIPYPQKFKGQGQPEHKLFDLCTRALDNLAGHVKDRVVVEIMHWQVNRDMYTGAMELSVGFGVIDTGTAHNTFIGSGYPRVSGKTSVQVINALMMPNIPRMEFPDVPEPIKDNGVSIEPIVAFRDFYIEPRDPDWTLMSRNLTPWEPYEKHVAICNKDNSQGIFGHDAPDENCGGNAMNGCGIYAFMNPDHKDMRNSSAYVWGEVYLWGKVLICDTGYRAQYAYPKILFIKDTGTQIIRYVADKLADKYGVPCLLMTGEKKRLSHMMDDALSSLLKGGES